jgi:hypothetical protein
MSDLVERLRDKASRGGVIPIHDVTLEAAADEIERLRGLLTNPPRHKFWGAGEADCPREIKAGNGELHTLRCKVCGLDTPRNDICLTAALIGSELGAAVAQVKP